MSFLSINPMSVKSESVVRQDLYTCRGCLATDSKLYDLLENRIEKDFSELTGLPEWGGVLCCVCLRLLRKFRLFRWRCRSANYLLQQTHTENKNVLSSVDRKHLKYNLVKTEATIINFDPCNQYTNLETTATFHLEVPSKYDIPDNLEIDTKFETNDLTTTLIGEFIVKDDIDAIKEDIFEDSEYGEQNQDNDFTWLPNDSDKDEEIPTINKHTNKKRKSAVSRKVRVKREDKKTSQRNKLTTKTLNSVKKYDCDRNLNQESSNESKVLQDDQILITKIASTLRGIWRKKKNKDIYQMFERIYKESLSFKDDDKSNDNLNKEEICTKKKIRSFLDLVKKLTEIYNVDIKFVRLDDLRKEMEDKRNAGEYKTATHCCELCCKNFHFADTYERHVSRNHNNAWNFECNICHYRFKTQRDLLAHLMMHARNIKCRECGANIPSKWNYAAKHADCHRGVMHKCTMCELAFTRKKSLSMHVRSKHRAQIGAVLCLLCGDTYNGDEGVKIHIRSMHKQASQCGSCAVWFRDSDTLDAHLRPAAGGCQPLHSSCPMCGANFANAELMMVHHKEEHPMYKCVECKTTFESRKTCIHNKYNHNLVKGKPRKQRPRYYNKDIICEVCGKNNFTCVATLKIHQRIHTGERPFQCDICQKRFRMRSDLKLHTAIHTGERSYKCPYCPRTFRQPPHLKSHLPTHTKERAHVCEICHKRFTQRANMQEHVRTIHEGLPPKRRQRHAKIFEA